MDANQFKQLLDIMQAQNEKLVKAMNKGHKVESVSLAVPQFHAFEKDKMNWTTYLMQLEQHFEANKITDDATKRASFLASVGNVSLELLQKLFDKELTSQTFKELTKSLSEHYVKKKHVLVSRCNFYKTHMLSEQSYTDWIANLRGAARDCAFVCPKPGCEESYADWEIRDMLVKHTPHESVRNAALMKTNPKLEEIIEIAQAYECSKRSSEIIKVGTQSNASESAHMVNHIKPNQNQRSNYNKSESQRYNQSRKSNNQTRSVFKSCPGCFEAHARRDCKHITSACNKCGKKGHIASVCQSAGSEQSSNQRQHGGKPGRSRNFNSYQSRKHTINEISDFQCINSVYGMESVESSELLTKTCTVKAQVPEKIMIEMGINGRQLLFQVDTGASCSMVGLEGYAQLSRPAYEVTDKVLKAYGDTNVPLLGVIKVQVTWEKIQCVLPLLIVDNAKASNILGMDWFKVLKFKLSMSNNRDLANVCSVADTSQHLVEGASKICADYPDLFSPTLGLCNAFQAEITLKPEARPKFWKPYNVPFALKKDVDDEIQRLLSSGILKSVNFSRWAAPIVAVKKPNGKVRICGDFKVTVNPQIEIDRYPIPRIEELFHKLQGGQFFTKVDLSDAYLQVELSEESKKLMVINTHSGLFQYQRLPFGVASAPGIFQRLMEEVTAGIPMCAVYLDDVIITGLNDDDHLRNLNELLSRLNRYGMRCKKEKCTFAAPNIEYVGHIINAEGINPSEKRLEPLKLMPRPTDVRQVEAFIGKINYYNKFIKNFSEIAAPLNELRHKGAKFVWTNRQETAFQALKSQLLCATRLVHYSEDRPIILATDASQYGVGAVVSHRFPDGSEHPIAFASKTLTKSQQAYGQIEKEALSIIYGVTKFHQYLYGREFELLTDHKPLTTIFHPCKKLPVATLHRLQRWAIALQGYKYNIQYRSTHKHANADALSRLPIGKDKNFDDYEEGLTDGDQVNQSALDELPVNSSLVAKATQEDPILKKVGRFIEVGWPSILSQSESEIKPYFDRKFALTVQSNCILLQTEYTRVIIPKSIQDSVLQLLHEGHWGSTRMKQVARRHVWFPNIDKEIERVVSNCNVCQSNMSDPRKTFSSWPAANHPWERIHVDFAGPFFSKMWLICVDAFSKFPYTVELKDITAATTIQALQSIFTIEGLPVTIVSDNGTQFTSEEFRKFCKLNSITHLTSAPFHPASNGQAERFVRTFKASFSKIMIDEDNRQKSLFKFLNTYRATSDPLVGKSPAELLHGRQPRTLISVLVPGPQYQRSEDVKDLCLGQAVYAKNFGRGERWISGTIVKVIGRKMFLIKSSIGVCRRHRNQIRTRVPKKQLPKEITNDLFLDGVLGKAFVPASPKDLSSSGTPGTSIIITEAEPLTSVSPTSITPRADIDDMSEPNKLTEFRRPKRYRNLPIRFRQN